MNQISSHQHYVSEFDTNQQLTHTFSPGMDSQINSLTNNDSRLSERELFKMQMTSPSIKKSSYKSPQINKI